MTDEKIIELITQYKEDKALVKLYRYQSVITTLVQKNGGSKEDALDIFQDALIIFCKRIWEGNFKLTSKIDTYLYSICYNLWRNELEKRNRRMASNSNSEMQLVDDDHMHELIEKESKIKQIETVLRKIGDPCMKLLKLFYYEALKMKEIAKQLGYKSEQTAKAQKYKCIERAKKMI